MNFNAQKMETSLEVAIKKLVRTWKINSPYTQSLRLVLKHCSYKNQNGNKLNHNHPKDKMEDFDLNTYKWNDKTALSMDALRLISTKAIAGIQEASAKPVLPSTFIKNRKKFLMKEVQLPTIVDERLESSKIVDIGFIEVNAVVSNDAKSVDKEPNISRVKIMKFICHEYYFHL